MITEDLNIILKTFYGNEYKISEGKKNIAGMIINKEKIDVISNIPLYPASSQLLTLMAINEDIITNKLSGVIDQKTSSLIIKMINDIRQNYYLHKGESSHRRTF